MQAGRMNLKDLREVSRHRLTVRSRQSNIKKDGMDKRQDEFYGNIYSQYRSERFQDRMKQEDSTKEGAGGLKNSVD